MGVGATTFNGIDGAQAYDTLRLLLSKIENGDVRVLEMSITQEAPETRSFRTIGGAVEKQMVVRDGEMSVTLRVALCDPMRQGVNANDKPRDVGTQRDMRTNPWRESSWNLTAQADFLKKFGPARAAEMALAALRMRDGNIAPSFTGEGVVFPRPKTEPQQAADPLRYGARKLDIDP